MPDQGHALAHQHEVTACDALLNSGAPSLRFSSRRHLITTVGVPNVPVSLLSLEVIGLEEI